MSSFESGERSAAGGLALLVAGSLLTQLVANLPPLVASTRLANSDAVAAAFGQAFVLVRIPLLLISPIQAMLLPDLTRSAARGDHAAVRGRVRIALAAVAVLGVVGTAVLAGAGPWVLRVFFGTGRGCRMRCWGCWGSGRFFLMGAAILQPTLVAVDRHRLVPIAWGVGAVVLGVLVELPMDPVRAAAAGGVGGPVAVVGVMGWGLGGALRKVGAESGAAGDAGMAAEAGAVLGSGAGMGRGDRGGARARGGAASAAARGTAGTVLASSGAAQAGDDAAGKALEGAAEAETEAEGRALAVPANASEMKSADDRARMGSKDAGGAKAEGDATGLRSADEMATEAERGNAAGVEGAGGVGSRGAARAVPASETGAGVTAEVGRGGAGGGSAAGRGGGRQGAMGGGIAEWWAGGGGRQVGGWGAELCAAVVGAGVMVGAARFIDVDPVARTGQVSALAALQVRFSVLGLVLVGVLMGAHRWRGGRGYGAAKRVVCAGFAGLASGFLGGGIVVALRGTPWPLFGLSGDTGRLVEWSESIVHGHGNPNPTYPPLTLHALAWWAQLFHHGDTATAFRDMEIGGAGLTGPAAYLAWRFVLSPLWALVVGVVPAYAIIDPYKPYGAVVMIVLLPLFVVSVRHTMRVGDMAWRGVLVSALLFGVLYSVLFLIYPGSSLWSAPGLVAAVLLLFPWGKAQVGKLLAFIGVTVAVFGVLCGWYVKDLIGPGNVDRAYGFDAYTDPAFFSMWRTDMPGDVGQWPPPGELAGVGLFSVLTFAGLGVALWLGWRRPLAVTVACVFIGTWLWRMEVASRMWATGTVQLWPRTGNQLLYCILVLGAAATAFVASRVASWPPLPSRLGAHVGVLAAVLLVLGSAASSVSDYWMPAKTNSYKILAYVSQTMRKPDGTCPKYAPNHECSATGDQSWMNNFAGPRNH